MDRGHNRESETGATGTSLRNAPASVHPMLAIDSQRQEEINDLHSFESCERAQRANDMVSEESHTTLRGTHPPKKKKAFHIIVEDAENLHFVKRTLT